MSAVGDRGEGSGRRYIAALLHFGAAVLWELGLCFLSPSSPSPCRSIPFTTCTPLKRPVSGFLYFFPHSVLSLLCFPSLLAAPSVSFSYTVCKSYELIYVSVEVWPAQSVLFLLFLLSYLPTGA